MRIALLAALSCAAISTSAFAQVAAEQQAIAPQAQPAAIVRVAHSTEVRLAANSEVVLALNSALNTKTHELGDKFSLTVAQDVLADGRVVIPRGTRAVGQVTRATGNGSFGKSGKMEVTFRYLDVGGKQIPLEGMYFQEGKGNTTGTLGAVVLAGVVGGMMVKGKEASIPEGREFTVHLRDDVPFLVPASGAAHGQISSSYVPSPVSMQVESDKERKKREKREKRQAERAG